MAVLSFVVSHLEFYMEIQRLPLRDTQLFDAIRCSWMNRVQ